MATTTKKKKTLTKAQKLENEIKRRTQVFNAASPAKKRVLIAEDVLAQIAARRYKPQTGSWITAFCGDTFFDNLVNIPDIDGDLIQHPDNGIPSNASVQKLFLDKTITSCSCCALGSLMMSCTLYSNKQTAEDLWGESDSLGAMVFDNEKLSNGLNKYFSNAQLQLIEVAFEGKFGYFGNEERAPAAQTVYEAALRFHEKYEHPTKRLQAIMENVIKNKGTFTP